MDDVMTSERNGPTSRVHTISASAALAAASAQNRTKKDSEQRGREGRTDVRTLSFRDMSKAATTATRVRAMRASADRDRDAVEKVGKVQGARLSMAADADADATESV